jgi:hypothetical protein
MALTKDVTFSANVKVTIEGIGTITEREEDLFVKDCYFKVETIAGDKSSLTATVSSQVSSSQKQFVSYTFTPLLDGPNFIAQAYEHLKTLPEFEGAIDC